jgi:acyl-CoA synthetase (AMP-forming)/AMP-acid ligase II
MFRALMTSRRFAPLFWRQFFSAFNDNFVRNMLTMLILFRFGGGDASLKILLATPCARPEHHARLLSSRKSRRDRSAPGRLARHGRYCRDRRGGLCRHQRAFKRFAKIAGEAVSLAAVEDLVAGLWPDHVAAAIAAPDPKHGERVILATTKPGATRAEVQAWMKIGGASEVMHPSSIVVLQAMPLLGSGKTNYVALAKALRESGA